jgi:hypothetical protein
VTPSPSRFSLTHYNDGPDCNEGCSHEIHCRWFGTVRARGGVLVTPRVLFYATGGLAYGQVNSSETIGGSPFSSSDTRVGYTVGGGIEGAIGGNPRSSNISLSTSAEPPDRSQRRSLPPAAARLPAITARTSPTTCYVSA